MIPTNEITVLQGVASASQAVGNADGTAIDFAGTYEPDVCVTLNCGVLGAAATALAKIQESADGTTGFTDVTTTATAVKATDDGKMFAATGRTTKRYIRVRLTVAGAASLASSSIIAKRRTIT